MAVRRRVPSAVVVALAAGVASLAPARAHAQEQHFWTFEGRAYYDPLIAAVRDPHVAALGLAWADRMDFMIEDDDPRQVWDIDLGAEIPILGWESAGGSGGARVPDGEWGIGFWIPIDFHMIEDFVDDSRPIVNTDYRFGGMVKAQFGVAQDRWLNLRAHIGHESTHLGDEFSIAGGEAFETTFERINVSWEYLDLGVLFEDRTGRVGFPWSVRIGATSTMPFDDDYWSTDSASVTSSAIGPVSLSANWIDPYVGAEAELEGLLPWSLAVYGSTEVRWRSIYDYHKADDDDEEERQLSFNAIVGFREAGGAGLLGRASPFVRLYHGVNPHGQFRNQAHFTMFGIGLRLVQ